MGEEANDEGMSAGLALVERAGDRALRVTRTFDAEPGTVFRAWSDAGLFRLWWMPRSMTGVSLVDCDIDARTGGTYRLAFEVGDSDKAVFHGTYIEIRDGARMVWTNDEGEDGAVTTVTFEGRPGGKTALSYHETYASAEALEQAITGSAAALPLQLEQLDELLSELKRT